MTDKQNYSLAIVRASSFLAQDTAMRAMPCPHFSQQQHDLNTQESDLFVWKALFTSKLLHEFEKEATISADFSESWPVLTGSEDITW